MLGIMPIMTSPPWLSHHWTVLFKSYRRRERYVVTLFCQQDVVICHTTRETIDCPTVRQVLAYVYNCWCTESRYWKIYLWNIARAVYSFRKIHCLVGIIGQWPHCTVLFQRRRRQKYYVTMITKTVSATQHAQLRGWTI